MNTAIEKEVPVAAPAKLKLITGDQPSMAASTETGAEAIALGVRASKAKSVEAKRQISTDIRKDLQQRGTFYRTQEVGDLLFFHKAERGLYQISAREFQALCADLYGINGKEPVWSYVEANIQDYCLRYGEPTEFFQFARYQGGKLYINAGGQRVFRLDGLTVDTIDNGDDGILFRSDPSLAPIEPDYKFTGSPVRDLLVNVANANSNGVLDLYHIYIYTLFFESILPTKPIVLFTGPKRGGKTSAARALKRALLGPSANVDAGMASKEDAFWAGICHSSVVCIDNVDTLVPWLADALAVVATGGKYKRRKLYETNTLVEYTPRCFPIVTSRNPQSFTRDDIVDRLLLIEVERRKTFVPEAELLAQLDEHRGQIWGELLTNLNKMVSELKKPSNTTPVKHRLADWARLAVRFSPVLGIANVEQKLDEMDASKVQFALDGQPLVEALEMWVGAHPDHDFIASGKLYAAICTMYDDMGLKFALKSARVFGMQLKNLRPELESRYTIEEKPGSNNTKLFRFSKHPEGAGQPLQTQPGPAPAAQPASAMADQL